MAKLYDGYEAPQERIYGYACEELGEMTADFCRNAASLDDFDAFAKVCENLGEQKVTAVSGTRYYPSDAVDSNRVLNAMLLMRYPFLAGMAAYTKFGENHKEYSGRYADYDDEYRESISRFDYTELDAMPEGWRRRFGIELCEDFRTVLESATDSVSAFAGYHVDQVKSKFATLRWYDGGFPEEIWDFMSDLNQIYEALSGGTCCVCGSLAEVRIDGGGWIDPICLRCRRSEERKREQSGHADEYVDAVAAEHGYEKSYIGANVSDAIRNAHIVKVTGPDVPIACNCKVRHFSANAGEESVVIDAFARLFGAMPSLRVFDFVTKHDEYLAMTEPLTEERAESLIDEAIAQAKIDDAEFKKKNHME